MAIARLETGEINAVREAVAKAGVSIQYDQPHTPSQIPSKFDRAVEMGVLVRGHAEGNVFINFGGQVVLAEAGEPIRLGKHGVRDMTSCSYEALTPVRPKVVPEVIFE